MTVEKGTGFDKLDKAKKDDFTENKLEKYKDQDLISTTDWDNCTKVTEDMSFSRSSNSKSIRLWWKLRIDEKEKDFTFIFYEHCCAHMPVTSFLPKFAYCNEKGCQLKEENKDGCHEVARKGMGWRLSKAMRI